MILDNHSRVFIERTGDENSDYINASYIDVSTSKHSLKDTESLNNLFYKFSPINF